jgi:hypothetical protein
MVVANANAAVVCPEGKVNGEPTLTNWRTFSKTKNGLNSPVQNLIDINNTALIKLDRIK